MNDYKSIIKKYRKRKGITQEALAKELNVSKNVVCGWESGNIRIPVDMADKAFTILGVSLRIGADPNNWKTERL